MRITIMSPLDRQFFGGTDSFDMEARTLFGLLGKLEELAPGFAELADLRVSFAVDGVIEPDWSASLASASEVVVLAKIAGG
ncbi:MAG: hypothetical protein EOP21_08400 [Hyphomicrobiales bacterium]|nr:MAG: hypothetical protein EOP21_08400 [Hyphomicrobiales bacterium]